MGGFSFREKIGAQFLDAGGAIYNVRHPDFGAVGDGVAVEDAAIRKAHGEGVPFFPAGAYRVSSDYDIWAVPFKAAGTGVRILQGENSYDISGAVAGEFCIRQGTVSGDQAFLELRSARNGRRIARIANEGSTSQAHRITLPIEVRRNSHSLILQPADLRCRTDILWRTALGSNVFQLDAVTQPGAERLVLLVDTEPARADGERKQSYAFDEAISVPGNDPAQPIEFRNLHLLIRRHLRFWARVSGNTIAPGDVEVRFVPNRTDLSVVVRELATAEERSVLRFSGEGLSVSGFNYPRLGETNNEEEPSTVGSGTHMFSIPALDRTSIPYKKRFYTQDRNGAGYIKLVTTISHADPGSSGAVVREYTFTRSVLTEMPARAIDSVNGGALIARVQRAGRHLEIYIDVISAGAFQISGYLEWCIARLPDNPS